MYFLHFSCIALGIDLAYKDSSKSVGMGIVSKVTFISIFSCMFRDKKIYMLNKFIYMLF